MIPATQYVLSNVLYCLIKRLQNGLVILPAGRLHNNTCAYFQRSGEVASAPFPCAATFPSLRAAHYSGLFRFVNTFFQGRLTEVGVVDSAASTLNPKAFRRCEPPIMPDFSSPSTPSFDQIVRRWWRAVSALFSEESVALQRGSEL